MTESALSMLLAAMPSASPAPDAGGATRVADLVSVIGASPQDDKSGWQAMREMLGHFGAQAERYRIVDMKDRLLIEIWFSSDGAAAMTWWQNRLCEIDQQRR